VIDGLLAPQRVLDRVAEALNRHLRADDAAEAQLRALAGRSVELRLGRLGVALCVAIEADGILLGTRSARAADVVIDGNLVDLLALARAHQAGESVPAGRVRIEGDLSTVRQLESALAALAFDLEASLARVLGPVPARQVARLVAGLRGFLRRAHASLERDLAQYLLDEQRLVPSVQEIDAFGAATLRLDTDLDRAAARLARLERRRRP
jgi:ubiquinone biosynthesis protein UbiJ